MAVAEKDVPRIQQVIQTAIRGGASMRAIVNKIEDAFEGLYNPKGFGSRALDIATLTYRIGGRKLLYALNHGLGLPSLRTLRNYMGFTRIMPTIGCISPSEIQHNIEEGVIKTRTAGNKTERRGVSVLMDEVALEEMACHFKHANSVGGLCWKHSHLVGLTLNTWNAAVNIAKCLANDTVHLGKEMSVVAVSLFGESGVYPLLAAPTCKQETAADMEWIFDTILEAWNKHGKAQVGPIWSFATDGDATRRAAGYNKFVKIPLSTASSLYGTLSNMPGLNLFTGEDEITLDFDYKHIFKRTYPINPVMHPLSNKKIRNMHTTSFTDRCRPQ